MRYKTNACVIFSNNARRKHSSDISPNSLLKIIYKHTGYKNYYTIVSVLIPEAKQNSFVKISSFFSNELFAD